MLGRLSAWRHVAVAITIASTTALAGLGLIGNAHPERFDAWQVVIEPWPPAGPNALRITETIDHDFGSNARHGPERYLPSNEFGRPTDVEASSPDAPDDVSIADIGGQMRIRIGNPNVTVSGQHRYTLAYTYPDARLDRGLLAIDAVDGDDFEMLRAEVIVRGFELRGPRCFAGRVGSTDRCELTAEDGLYRAMFQPLPAHTAVTIDGEIAGRIRPTPVVEPPIPARRGSDRFQAMLAIAGLGALGAGSVYVWARRRGRNEVYDGGATDAAFGPGAGAPVDIAPTTRLVADQAMDELATIEFVPPDGVEPWEGRVLLAERLDDDAVAAWFSGMAGREVITLSDKAGRLEIARGPKYGAVTGPERALLDRVAGKKPRVVGNRYDAAFASAWVSIRAFQRRRIKQSGWWTRPPPSGRTVGRQSVFVIVFIVAMTLPFVIVGLIALSGVLKTWWVAVPLGLLLPAFVAWIAYRVLLPARTAAGSALALRTESFRRFLHASEGQHVTWAWERGVLREYSGWAVALDEAEAWARAFDQADVPPEATLARSPLVLPALSSAIQASHIEPPSSGGSGGSSSSSSDSFSGGSAGGGGGGGSHGSW